MRSIYIEINVYPLLAYGKVKHCFTREFPCVLRLQAASCVLQVACCGCALAHFMRGCVLSMRGSMNWPIVYKLQVNYTFIMSLWHYKYSKFFQFFIIHVVFLCTLVFFDVSVFQLKSYKVICTNNLLSEFTNFWLIDICSFHEGRIGMNVWTYVTIQF